MWRVGGVDVGHGELMWGMGLDVGHGGLMWGMGALSQALEGLMCGMEGICMMVACIGTFFFLFLA